MALSPRRAGSAEEVESMYLGPLVFEEIFVAKPWGGRSLARAAAKRLPPGERIGESWEIADHPNGTSVVKGGPEAGRTLRELIRAHGESLLGRKAARGRFPLLVKLLDVSDAFSVQVHPDDACARAMKLRDCGKTEAWYVLRGGKRRMGRQRPQGGERHAETPRAGRLRRTGRADAEGLRAHGRRLALPGRHDPRLRRRGGAVRGPAELGRDVPPLRLGPRRGRRQAARAPSR